MAQPNVVREPSMEEILASIRRIIESNEPVGAKPIPSTHFAGSGMRDDDIQLTVDEEFAAADRARSAEHEPRFVAANSQMPVVEPDAAGRGLSLADVAARVRAASERNTAALLNAGREPPQPRELPPAMVARLAEAHVEPITDVPLRHAVADVAAPVAPPAMQAMAEVRIEPDMEEVRPMATAPAPQIAAPVEAPVFHAPESLAAVAAEVETSLPPAQAMSASPLMSEAAGAQVSRSFEELAAIVDGGPRRSLDELAQEMLRPMLQEWLDDNLPTLVERLVREEIERVARGPRR
ncbi:PopZ family protein [Rhizobium sp. NPDC090279]|uniref:PopZ family protein n=1 Tax=Rhizobium sp. NPDC090279 TaxID=3364499 RepID=UPI00383AD240